MSRSLVKFVLLASLALMAVAFWRKDALPRPGELRSELHQDPQQAAVGERPVDITVRGVTYAIRPRYSYDLYGLVVSMHDSDTWWDQAHREWNDHVNVVDLCVVWGANVRRDAYRAISFSNNEWECHWSTGSREAWQAFDQSAVANNHMVTDDPHIARRMRDVRVGDQVRFRGYLVDYTTYKNGAAAGTRVSSTVRNDTGNGACEVVYVKDFEILRATNRHWRILGKVAFWAFIAGLLAWIALPYRPRD